jgi:NAD(P)-dependent dehydrogenase (short-subunit alcohol dehydrogenase family)
MRALVTGGGRGIGAAIAADLVRAGWEVIVSARSQAQLDAVAAELGAQPLVLDVSDPVAVADAFRAAGEIDLLVANAGVNHRDSPSWEMPEEDWWRILEINVRGVELCCRAVIPGMLERERGRIVIVGSRGAYASGFTLNAYCVSKAAVCRYAEVLANELAGRIPVFCISPGRVRTAMTEDRFAEDKWVAPTHAAEFVTRLAQGGYDVLAGRFLHSVHDDLDALRATLEREDDPDLHMIRLQAG